MSQSLPFFQEERLQQKEKERLTCILWGKGFEKNILYENMAII